MLASNPSAAAVQWHGRCRHWDGIALLFDHAIGEKRKMPGVWGRSPRSLDVAKLHVQKKHMNCGD
jgi:hypothetical protein